MNTKRLKEAKNVFIKRSFVLGIVAILVCWFMKMVGFDIFGLDLNNKFFNDFDKFMKNNEWLKQIYYTITLNIQLYLMVGIVKQESGKSIIKYLLKLLPFTIIFKTVMCLFENELGAITIVLEFLYLVLVSSGFKLRYLGKGFVTIVLLLIYQIISLTMRSLNLQAQAYNFVIVEILSIDMYLLLYLTKEVAIMNEGTWLFFGLTAWLYAVAGFIVGLFTLHPIKKAKEYYAKGKAKEDARKTKKTSTKTAKAK